MEFTSQKLTRMKIMYDTGIREARSSMETQLIVMALVELEETW